MGGTLNGALTAFLSSGFGTAVKDILTLVGIILIVFGIAHAVLTRHKAGAGAVFRRVLEVLLLGVVLAVPQIWSGIITVLVTVVHDAATYVGKVVP
jgi:hypothetical protein